MHRAGRTRLVFDQGVVSSERRGKRRCRDFTNERFRRRSPTAEARARRHRIAPLKDRGSNWFLCDAQPLDYCFGYWCFRVFGAPSSKFTEHELAESNAKPPQSDDTSLPASPSDTKVQSPRIAKDIAPTSLRTPPIWGCPRSTETFGEQAGFQLVLCDLSQNG